MYKRLLILLTLILSVAPLASVNAQSLAEGFDYCLFLPADDCQILVQSTEVMSEVGSFAFDMSLVYDIAIEGGNLGIDDLSFGIDGSGLLALDVETFNKYKDLAMSDPAAYMDQLPTILDGLLSGVEGEIYLEVSLPDILAMMTGGTTEIPLNLLMKDGVYVIDVASLEEALGQDPSGMDWTGIDLNGAFESLMSDVDLSSLGGDAMADGMPEFDMEMLQDAITIERLDDSNIDGTSVAVFEMVVDYGSLLASSDMMDMLESVYGEAGMDQDTIDTTLSMLDEIEIVVLQYIGLDDFYTYRMEMSMDFAIDGELLGDPTMDSISFDIGMWFEMSDFNTPVDIQLPEDATIFPASMLTGGGL
jgi:hypothetical protein